MIKTNKIIFFAFSILLGCHNLTYGMENEPLLPQESKKIKKEKEKAGIRAAEHAFYHEDFRKYTAAKKAALLYQQLLYKIGTVENDNEINVRAKIDQFINEYQQKYPNDDYVKDAVNKTEKFGKKTALEWLKKADPKEDLLSMLRPNISATDSELIDSVVLAAFKNNLIKYREFLIYENLCHKATGEGLNKAENRVLETLKSLFDNYISLYPNNTFVIENIKKIKEFEENINKLL